MWGGMWFQVLGLQTEGLFSKLGPPI